MKRLASVALLAALALAPRLALAQEGEGGAKKESFAEKYELELKWVNFLILAGVIGYYIGKNAGPFFDARSAGIRKDMDESMRQSQEAQARADEVDRRLANLEADIAALSAENDLETKTETERMARQTADEIAKIQAHAEREIASAGKAARMELKRYTAEMAVSLAEQKIRSRMSPDAQNAMVDEFVRNLK